MAVSFQCITKSTTTKKKKKKSQNRIKSLEVETHFCVLVLGLAGKFVWFFVTSYGKTQMKFLAHSVWSDSCPVISPSWLMLLLFNVLLNYALTILNFLLNFKYSKMICILGSSSLLLSMRSSSPQIPNANSFLISWIITQRIYIYTLVKEAPTHSYSLLPCFIFFKTLIWSYLFAYLFT